MKHQTSIAASVVAVIAVAVAASAAFAAKEADNDAMAILGAKVGLQQAVAVAEGHVGGKAARAEYEKNKAGAWVFDIEVVKTGAVMDVTVDASSGKVLTAVPDKADKDDDKDQAD